MLKNFATPLLFAVVCTTASAMAAAQSKAVETASAGSGSKLRMVVILTRHGVRSPTWTQERLDSYSAQPWPKWNVPPGNLTERGYTLIQQFGSFDRASLSEQGLFSAQGCEDASKVYVWADTDQRTIASGKAIAEGLFPTCAPEVHGLPAGGDDPLFHPATKAAKKEQTDVAGLAGPRDPSQHTLLEQMQNVLHGCDPKTACTPARVPHLPLLGGASALPAGGSMDAQEDPLALASTFSEDFLLEYADGMPMEQVGWGHVDEQQLRRFLALHSDYFDKVHRMPELAQAEASNMLRGITNTLEQAVDGTPVAGAIGPTGMKLVVLAGHDTNIAGVAALLGLHWKLDGRSDDTPPDTELAFELWQHKAGAYAVRVTVAMQTLNQLREMTALTVEVPPLREALALRGCGKSSDVCAWDKFRAIAHQPSSTTEPPVQSHRLATGSNEKP